MPCYDARGHNDSANTERENSELRRENAKLDAILCAVYSELIKANIFETIVYNAEVMGKIGIMGHFKSHKQSDAMRLAKDLNKYSQHEIELIKKILGAAE